METTAIVLAAASWLALPPQSAPGETWDGLNGPTGDPRGLLLSAQAILGQAPDTTSERTELLIRDVTVVSAERSEPLERAWVGLRDGLIAGVGTGSPDESWSQAVIVDGAGRFLTPGLIDSHVHLAGVPGLAYPLTPEVRPLARTYQEQLPRSYLYFGYTTVIDLNVVDRDFIEQLKRAPVGPDIYDCDGALALANGYPMVFQPPETRFEMAPNFLYDPRQADSIPARYAPENHTPAACVARVAVSGAVGVKVHWEDGFGPAKIWPTPTHEMIEAVIEASHDRGLTVTMHANSYGAQRFAVEVGVDVIVHGMWNWDGLRSIGGLPPPIAEVLDAIVADDVGFMPTMQVLAGLQLLYDPPFLDDPQLRKVVPSDLIDWYRTEAGRWFAEELRAEDFEGLDDDEARAIVNGGLAQGARVVRYLAERDARLLFGSDTPSSPTYGNPPGYNGYMEMQRLVEAGVSLRQLLRAATLANAEAFHLDDRYGTVEPGKVANLLLLSENPLKSVEAWDSIDAVVIRGRMVERSALSAEAR